MRFCIQNYRRDDYHNRRIQGGWTYPDENFVLLYKDRASTVRRFRTLMSDLLQAKAQGKTHKIWRTASDSEVRNSHRSVDGMMVGIDEYFVVNGERLRLPCDTERGKPENTFNCRCRVEFVTRIPSGRPLSAYGEGRDTIIRYSDGMEEVRSGGTRAWRNNNPGNILHTDFAVRQGSLGQAGGFAVFTRLQTHKRATRFGLRRA